MNASKTYFPGLNALRFIAATLVIFHHLEQYKFWSNQQSLWGRPFIDALGHKPVGLFFVLSGFLITYLLLEENRDCKKIKIGTFYLKRVLRIWPLYFVIVIVSLWLIPLISNSAFPGIQNPNNPTVLISLVLILPNLLRIAFPVLLGANQLWSVGIEEQFYFFWPILVKRFANKIISFLVIFIALKLGIHLIILVVLKFTDILWLSQLEKLYALFPVEQMAIGGLGAGFIFKKNTKIMNIMGSKKAAFVSAIAIVLSSFYQIDIFISSLIDAILFMIVIYQVTINKKIYTFLENSTLNYLGSISYGIYMWHTVAITLSIILMDHWGWSSYWGLTMITLLVTLAFSYFSFRFIEKPIQRLRTYKFKFKEVGKLTSLTNATS